MIHVLIYNYLTQDKKAKPVHYYGPKQPKAEQFRDPNFGRSVMDSDIHLWFRKGTVIDPTGRTRW